MPKDKKLKKYIILGRRLIIKNQDGDNIHKLISEIYKKVPSSAYITIYKRIYYREIKGNRGIDVSDICSDTSMDADCDYITFDGTIDNFFNMNFMGYPDLEENTLLKFRTYGNKNFIKRTRSTSYHEDLNYSDLIKRYKKNDTSNP